MPNKCEYVSYKSASGIRFIDLKREDISKYPKGVSDIQDYYEETEQSFLKSCPFCGSNAEKLIKLYGTDMFSNTKCTNKECIASFKSVPHKIWNTRYTYKE